MPEIGANLSDKFQAILDALNSMAAGQADLLAAQNATNAKLDQLIAKDFTATITGDLIADMSGVETRLDSIYNLWAQTGDDLRPYGLLSNILLALENLAGAAPGRSLADIYAALIGTSGDTTDIRQAIWNLAGPAPGASILDLYNLFVQTGDDLRPYGLLSNIALESETTRQLLAAFVDTFGDRGAGLDFYDMTDQININLAGVLQALGTPTGDATTTVLGRLLAIANATKCACKALNPTGPEPDDECSGTAYESDGFVTAEYGSQGEMVVAYWNDAPSGLVLSDGGKTLANGEADWSGWSVYVTSTAQYFGYKNGFSNRLPTNQWVDLSDYADELSFAVDVGHGLSVTLCGAEESNWEELSNGGQYVSYRYIVWPTTWPSYALSPWANIFLELPVGQNLEIKTAYSSVEVQPTGEDAILIPVGGTGITVTGPKEITVGRPQGLGNYTILARLVV